MAAVIASAQVQFLFVEKLVNYQQNSAAAPTVQPGTSYQFKFELNGTTIAGFTPVQITTLASGSLYAGTVPIPAIYSNVGGEERWKSANLNYTSQALMDADFKNGVYGLNVNGTTFNVTVGSGAGPYLDSYPAAAPMVTGLSAGDFDGSGNLKINLNLSSYTFNLNGLPGYSSGGHVGIFISNVLVGGNPVEEQSIKFGTFNDPELTFLTFNPSASTMVLGNTYTLELEYNLAPNAAQNLLGDGELDLGLFTYRTQMSLIAVPEPSTYAAIFGAVALAGVIFHRRRRVVV